MGDKTGIEWTDATWNPTSGCHKVSAGCKNCYAERVFPRAYAKSGRKFTDVALHYDRLDHPIRWQRPRRIFVDSMSDLFHEAVPFDFVDQVFARMVIANQHTYQVLTKRPERMLEYLSQPDVYRMWNAHAIGLRFRRPHFGGVTADWWGQHSQHIWLGVSVEDQEAADERIPLLLKTPAAVRFLSCEPLLGPVDLRPKDASAVWGVDWVIVGGESGPRARPMEFQWALELRNQCLETGIPYFFKQDSEYNYPKTFKVFEAFDPALQVREFPQ